MHRFKDILFVAFTTGPELIASVAEAEALAKANNAH